MRTSPSLPYVGGGGVSVQEGSLSRGSLSRGVSVQGVLCSGRSLSGGVSVQGALCPGGSLSRGSLSMRTETPPPPNRITDASENITSLRMVVKTNCKTIVKLQSEFTYKARHAHITSCRLMKDNKPAVDLNDLLKNTYAKGAIEK